MSRLSLTAVGVGFLAVIGAGWCHHQIQNNFRRQEYYMMAAKLFNEYEPANEVLGQPVRFGYLNLGNGTVIASGTEAKLKIPLKGSKKSGALYVKASRPDVYQKWQIDRLDMEIERSVPWTFYTTNSSKNKTWME